MKNSYLIIAILLAAIVALLICPPARVQRFVLLEPNAQPAPNARIVWRMDSKTGAVSTCSLILDKLDGDNLICSKNAREFEKDSK